jgi:branched-chain amino acid transport system substrate-binding protein
MRSRYFKLGAALAAGGLLATGCGSSSKSTSATTSQSPSATTTPGGGAKTAAPISIGFISSQTGGASSSYVGSQWGAEARIDAQNAAGGVNGHMLRLVLEDDQSSPAANQTAAQELVQSKKVFGVIEDSSFTFGASKYLNQEGVPVTGAAIDGPEWAAQPNTNMFSVTVPDDGSVGGKYYTYTNEANFIKAIGITKLAGVVYNIESAIQSMSGIFQTAQLQGIKNCYVDTSVPFGDVNFTATALSIKSAGCDGVTGVSLLATDIALSAALNEAGVKTEQVYPTAYDQNLLSQKSALNSMQGDYTEADVNFQTPNAAAETMLTDLKKYTAFPGGIPSLNILQGYTAADLMIDGLKLAGPNPTRASFISNLRQVDNYTAGGLYPSGVTFKGFGTAAQLPPTSCSYWMKIVPTGYMPYKGGASICGKLVSVKAGAP